MEQEPQKSIPEIKDLPGDGTIETTPEEEIEAKRVLLKITKERLAELEKEAEGLFVQFREKFKIWKIHAKDNNSASSPLKEGGKTYTEQGNKEEEHEVVLELGRRLRHLKKRKIPDLKNEIGALKRSLNI